MQRAIREHAIKLSQDRQLSDRRERYIDEKAKQLFDEKGQLKRDGEDEFEDIPTPMQRAIREHAIKLSQDRQLEVNVSDARERDIGDRDQLLATKAAQFEKLLPVTQKAERDKVIAERKTVKNDLSVSHSTRAQTRLESVKEDQQETYLSNEDNQAVAETMRQYQAIRKGDEELLRAFAQPFFNYTYVRTDEKLLAYVPPDIAAQIRKEHKILLDRLLTEPSHAVVIGRKKISQAVAATVRQYQAIREGNKESLRAVAQHFTDEALLADVPPDIAAKIREEHEIELGAAPLHAAVKSSQVETERRDVVVDPNEQRRLTYQPSPKKYDGRLVMVQKGNGQDLLPEVAATRLAGKLVERYGRENVAVVSSDSKGRQEVLQGDPSHLRGDLKVQIVGHGGWSDKGATLGGKRGIYLNFDMRETLRTLPPLIKEGGTSRWANIPQTPKLQSQQDPTCIKKVSLLGCDSGGDLRQDVERHLPRGVQVKGYQGAIDITEAGKRTKAKGGGLGKPKKKAKKPQQHRHDEQQRSDAERPQVQGAEGGEGTT